MSLKDFTIIINNVIHDPPWPLEIVGTTVILLTAVITIFLRMSLEDLFMWKCHYNVLHVDEPPWSFAIEGTAAVARVTAGTATDVCGDLAELILCFLGTGACDGEGGPPPFSLSFFLRLYGTNNLTGPVWKYIYIVMVYHTPNSDTEQTTVQFCCLVGTYNMVLGYILYVTEEDLLLCQ